MIYSISKLLFCREVWLKGSGSLFCNILGIHAHTLTTRKRSGFVLWDESRSKGDFLLINMHFPEIKRVINFYLWIQSILPLVAIMLTLLPLRTLDWPYDLPSLQCPLPFLSFHSTVHLSVLLCNWSLLSLHSTALKARLVSSDHQEYAY